VKEFQQAITCFNPKIIESVVQGILVFIIEETVTKMFNLSKIGITKLLAKPTKEKDTKIEKEKEAATYRKITSPEALVDYEGWKVSFLKGMYVTKLPALIQVI
jgi:hypothetical protein